MYDEYHTNIIPRCLEGSELYWGMRHTPFPVPDTSVQRCTHTARTRSTFGRLPPVQSITHTMKPRRHEAQSGSAVGDNVCIWDHVSPRGQRAVSFRVRPPVCTSRRQHRLWSVARSGSCQCVKPCQRCWQEYTCCVTCCVISVPPSAEANAHCGYRMMLD